jgi:hypothetical protein
LVSSDVSGFRIEKELAECSVLMKPVSSFIFEYRSIRHTDMYPECCKLAKALYGVWNLNVYLATVVHSVFPPEFRVAASPAGGPMIIKSRILYSATM